jgi:hypothetical protein
MKLMRTTLNAKIGVDVVTIGVVAMNYVLFVLIYIGDMCSYFDQDDGFEQELEIRDEEQLQTRETDSAVSEIRPSQSASNVSGKSNRSYVHEFAMKVQNGFICKVQTKGKVCDRLVKGSQSQTTNIKSHLLTAHRIADPSKPKVLKSIESFLVPMKGNHKTARKSTYI